MSFLILPAGQSLRTVAEKLGVSIEELRTQAGIADIEAPLKTEKRIEVPDGFLRSRAAKEQVKEAAVAESSRRGGMNAWLALDIEQKRTRAAGGMNARTANTAEEEALLEARRAYLRFEADSNDLAIDLYNQASLTHAVEIRARAFAGMGCAYAQRRLLFGETLERSQPHALSAAKAALWADPRLTDALLAMALALRTSGRRVDLEEARRELNKALAASPRDPWCWAELGRVQEQLGEIDAAALSVAQALQLDSENLFALEAAASLSLRQNKPGEAMSFFTKACNSSPTYANCRLHRAVLLKSQGRLEEAEQMKVEAFTLAKSETHRSSLMDQYAKGQLALISNTV